MTFRTIILLGFAANIVLLSSNTKSFAQKNSSVKQIINLIEVGDIKQALNSAKTLYAAENKNAEVQAVYALAAMVSGDMSTAEQQIASAFDNDRKNVFVRNVRGMIFGRKGNIEDALKEFKQAIKYDEKDVSSYLYLSRYYISLDSLKAAEVLLYRAQGVAPNDIRSYLGLGELYEKQRVNELAIKQYQDAIKLNPSDITVHAKLARLYTRNRQYSESANEWIQLIKIDSTFAQAYYEVASLFLLGEQYANAVRYSEKYVSLRPDDIFGNWLYARALSEAGQYAKALPYLEIAAKSDSLRPLTELYRARGYFLSGDFAKAVEIFTREKNLDPFDKYYWGYSLISSGDTVAGIEKWEESLIGDTIRSQEQKSKLERQIIGMYAAIKQYDKAADVYFRLAQASNNADYFIIAGQYYAFGGKTSQAVQAFQKALSLNPSAVKAYVGIADVYMKETGRDPEVAEQLMKASENATTNDDKNAVGEAYGRLGQRYLTDRDYTKAAEVLLNGIKLINDASAYKINLNLMLGISYVQLKKYDAARDYISKVLSMDPKNDIAKQQMDFLNSLKKQDGGKAGK